MDTVSSLMTLDFWFSLAPLPWWSLVKAFSFAIGGVALAHWASDFPGGWRIVATVVSYISVILAVVNALLIAHNDAVARCLVVLNSVY